MRYTKTTPTSTQGNLPAIGIRLGTQRIEHQTSMDCYSLGLGDFVHEARDRDVDPFEASPQQDPLGAKLCSKDANDAILVLDSLVSKIS